MGPAAKGLGVTVTIGWTEPANTKLAIYIYLSWIEALFHAVFYFLLIAAKQINEERHIKISITFLF